MASTWSSGMTFQPPPPYSSQEDDSNYGMGFTFLDFLPECRDPGGFISSAVYDTFRTLVNRANDWLQANRSWKVITCESVEFKSKYDEADTEKMTYMEHGERSTYYVRGLRLWMSQRKTEANKAQEIGYRNLIPRQVEEGGLFGRASYETVDEVIRNFNASQHSNPFSGRVITVETQEMKLSHYHELDPDRSNWKERGDHAKRCLFVIRIFYEVMAGNSEEIGIKDFIPDRVTKGGIFSLPDYEPFSNVVSKASDWCLRQQGLWVCNVQSVEIKMKIGDGSVDTQKTEFTEHGGRGTFYLRILRVAYTRPRAADVNPSSTGVTQLTCRTFEPVQLTTGMFVPDYETLQETKRRVTAWVKATGARVISAETSAMRIFTGGERRHGAEASFTYNRAEASEYWIFVIRLYLNGAYREPPPEMLPPVPELQNTDCCVIL